MGMHMNGDVAGCEGIEWTHNPPLLLFLFTVSCLLCFLEQLQGLNQTRCCRTKTHTHTLGEVETQAHTHTYTHL